MNSATYLRTGPLRASLSPNRPSRLREMGVVRRIELRDGNSPRYIRESAEIIRRLTREMCISRADDSVVVDMLTDPALITTRASTDTDADADAASGRGVSSSDGGVGARLPLAIEVERRELERREGRQSYIRVTSELHCSCIRVTSELRPSYITVASYLHHG